MSIREALRKYGQVEIDLLLSHVLGKSREFLFMSGDNRLTRMQTDRLTRMIKRRLKGEPVAYILGCKDFMGLRFKVNRHVLIPRPETEELVKMVMEHVTRSTKQPYKRSSRAFGPRDNGKMRILDLGTGSGCVIISLAKLLSAQHPKISIKLYASDISAKALAVAKENAKAHRANVKFVRSDLLQNLKSKFDVIIANLPYGWQAWKNNTSAETVGLKFEPKQALFTGEAGLYQIRRLLQQVAETQSVTKVLFLEFDPRQKLKLGKLINRILPRSRVNFYKDFNGLWRYAQIAIGK